VFALFCWNYFSAGCFQATLIFTGLSLVFGFNISTSRLSCLLQLQPLSHLWKYSEPISRMDFSSTEQNFGILSTLVAWIELDSLNHLQHLKSVHGRFSGEPQQVFLVNWFDFKIYVTIMHFNFMFQMLDFIRIHPNLEHMTIHYKQANMGGMAFYVPNSV